MAAKKKRSGREPLGIQSVEIAARILRALAEGGGALALRDLAAAAGMHRGKAHRYLVSLARAGLVTREAEAGRYGIGPLAISAGLAGLNRLNPVRLAYEALPALRDRIGETVVLAVWGERGATVIALEDSARPVTLNVRVGSILPLRTSAIGRVFAAMTSQGAANVRAGRASGQIEDGLAAAAMFHSLRTAPGVHAPVRLLRHVGASEEFVADVEAAHAAWQSVVKPVRKAGRRADLLVLVADMPRLGKGERRKRRPVRRGRARPRFR